MYDVNEFGIRLLTRLNATSTPGYWPPDWEVCKMEYLGSWYDGCILRCLHIGGTKIDIEYDNVGIFIGGECYPWVKITDVTYVDYQVRIKTKGEWITLSGIEK